MQEKIPTALKISVVILGVVAVVSISLIFWGMPGEVEEDPTPIPGKENPETAVTPKVEKEVVPVNAPADVSQQEEVIKTQASEPEPISDDVEAQIQAVADRIGKGEITREEGQKEINKILGI